MPESRSMFALPPWTRAGALAFVIAAGPACLAVPPPDEDGAADMADTDAIPPVNNDGAGDPTGGPGGADQDDDPVDDGGAVAFDLGGMGPPPAADDTTGTGTGDESGSGSGTDSGTGTDTGTDSGTDTGAESGGSGSTGG